MIECKLCGKKFKTVRSHLSKTHKISEHEYLKDFPDAPLVDPEFSKRRSRDHKKLLKNNPKMLGEWTEERRKNHSDYRKSMKGKMKPSKTRSETMKTLWKNEKQRQIYSDGIRNSYTDERRRKISISVRERLKKNGYHLNKHGGTKLEKVVEQIFEQRGISYKRQFITKEKILDKYRFFDFYLPVLNLIVEVDGEYWHNNIKRINLDFLKQEYADKNGFGFIRISDTEITNAETMIFDWCQDKQKHHSYRLLERRLNGEMPIGTKVKVSF